MTAGELIALGSTAFGPGWKAPLSLALGCRRETVWRYATERSPIPEEIALKVTRICKKRITSNRAKHDRALARLGA